MNIRIGMIGAGGIAKSRHLPNLKEIEGVELAAVANRRYENAQEAAEQFGFRKVYKTWQEVADDSEVDAVFICTPPILHREISEYCIARGKHVFSQARMAMDLEDALQMYKLDQSTSLTTMLCPPPNYMKVEPFVMQLLKDGELGEVRHVHLTHPSSQYADASKPLYWRQRADLQGINVLDVGIMGEVLNKWFGPLQSLCADGRIWVEERPQDGDGRSRVELPDSVTVLGQFARGPLLTALFTGAVQGGQSQLTIYGSKGTLTCYPERTQLALHTGGEERKLEVPEAQRKEWTVERDFIQAVRGGTKGSPSFTDGVRYMAFTQAVMDSIRTGQRVEVAHIE
ncbi:Gfo/Idh/MocA family protein [Paenibacillus sp. OAS669]|uniref:Gfo/Idh/MocA family protein n=1 Tax=Paenibacillus sp. OAS669 TaxID=2663821 RepID=UPI00178BDED7|nr:Gfo/Idh/MocA family oxidoreductase [Paenibacillus sp. OAS669]MBE1441297.1 putative dehydrogenase [Paenibacillus sp. OAS669]